ncbi:TIGR02391 family protein [Clostridium perfringens]|uniref:TIGR02391 family protein n=1 Tax=Clostridium perfringens TaxID=1502 RepID=UPI00096A4DFD|nr:TIGR02391 family protein [Clostridium perfringens]
MRKYNKFDINTLNQLSIILGNHLTGSQITNFFKQVGYNENSNMTKKVRIYDFFSYTQKEYECSNKILEFIQKVVAPVNHVNNQFDFLKLIKELNQILAFSGLFINESGLFINISKSTTINEARAKANNLRKILFARNIHPDVLKFCTPELIQENYFHAVFEATKSVSEKLRRISNSTLDGNQLVYQVFDKNEPLIAINSLSKPSEINEQLGFKHLLLGIFSMFRNTHAHEPKISWYISEQDALDLFTTLSFIHRKLDNAIKIPIV